MIPKEYQEYEESVTVAAVNFNPVWGNKAATLEKIKNNIVAAAKIGSNIIAFPELALSGYECGEETRREKMACAVHEAGAETIPGPSTDEISRLTKDLDVYVLLGMPERDTYDPKKRYISVAVIGPEGVIGRYRKITIAPAPKWTEATCGFSPGNELPIFETRYGPIGVQICAAFWHIPEYTRILCHKGARIIFNCTGSSSGPGKIERMSQVNMTRGNESFVYAVSANLVGTEKTISYYGHSCIAGCSFPIPTRVFAEGGEAEEIVTATLSFDNLHSWWAVSDPKKMIDLDLVAREFAGLAKNRQSQ